MGRLFTVAHRANVKKKGVVRGVEEASLVCTSTHLLVTYPEFTSGRSAGSLLRPSTRGDRRVASLICRCFGHKVMDSTLYVD